MKRYTLVKIILEADTRQEMENKIIEKGINLKTAEYAEFFLDEQKLEPALFTKIPISVMLNKGFLVFRNKSNIIRHAFTIMSNDRQKVVNLIMIHMAELEKMKFAIGNELCCQK